MTRDEAKVVAYALATLASHIRCGSGWNDDCTKAYKDARDILQREQTEARREQAKVARFLAVNPADPCTWPVGTCRFAKP